MQNPVSNTFKSRKPFTYFHTHVIDRAILDAAVAAIKSLEVDLSIDLAGRIYVGHPLPMYEFKHLPPPNNLPLETILEEMKAAGVYLIVDVKDVKVLAKAQESILSYGIDNTLLHSCVKELVFKPYSKKIIVEPHWEDEQLPVDEVLKVKQASNVPLALSCRGLSEELISNQGEDSVVNRIVEVASGKAEVVVLNLPNDELPPMSIMQRLLKHNILSCFSIDRVPPENRPLIYLGTTDILDRASAFRIV